MRFQRFHDFGSLALLLGSLLRFQPLIRLLGSTCRRSCVQVFAYVIEIDQKIPIRSEHSVGLVRDPRRSVPQAVNRACFAHARADCTVEPMIPRLLRTPHGRTKDRGYRSFRASEGQPAFLPGHFPILASVPTGIGGRPGVGLHNRNHRSICFRHKRCHGSFLGDLRLQDLHCTHSVGMFLRDAAFGSRRYRNAIMLAEFLARFFK